MRIILIKENPRSITAQLVASGHEVWYGGNTGNMTGGAELRAEKIA
jgi:hypothetical protein